MTVKRGRSIFWVLYAFFFAVPFPMILYYSINYTGGETQRLAALSEPYWALTYLLFSLALWLWLLVCMFQQWVVLPVKAQHRALDLLRTGIIRDAEVVACNEVGKPTEDTMTLDVTFRFHNLSGVPIRETLHVVDTRPKQGRCQIGRLVRLRINKNLVKPPIIAIDGSTFQVKQTRRAVSLLGWFLLAGGVAGYYVLSYTYEHHGTGWRFLTFYHPLVLCPLTLLGTWWLFGGGLGRLFSNSEDWLQLKYRGYRAEARLMSAAQTGTYVNEQPQVRFELEYEDRNGITHKTSFKKIVDLLAMDIARSKTIPIFYLADQPQTIAFAADLGETE